MILTEREFAFFAGGMVMGSIASGASWRPAGHFLPPACRQALLEALQRTMHGPVSVRLAAVLEPRDVSVDAFVAALGDFGLGPGQVAPDAVGPYR